MRKLKIVLNRTSEKPIVLNIDCIAYVHLTFSTSTDVFVKDTGYNDLFISMPKDINPREVFKRVVFAKADTDFIPGYNTYLIWCYDYTIMN